MESTPHYPINCKFNSHIITLLLLYVHVNNLDAKFMSVRLDCIQRKLFSY